MNNNAGLTEFFSSLSDDELLRRAQPGSLVPEAEALAHAELLARGLPVPQTLASATDDERIVDPSTGLVADRRVLLERNLSPQEAQLRAQFLRTMGIAADEGDVNAVQAQGLFAIALGGASIRVPENQRAEAAQLLRAFDAGEFALPSDDRVQVLRPGSEPSRTGLILFRSRLLVERMRSPEFGHKERAKYFLAFWLLNIGFAYFITASNAGYSVFAVIEALLLSLVIVLGTTACYRAHPKGNADFVSDITCILVPVSNSVRLVVWGINWLMILAITKLAVIDPHWFVNAKGPELQALLAVLLAESVIFLIARARILQLGGQ